MITLAVMASVHWAHIGNTQLRQNWEQGQASSGRAIARQLFNGFCLGMLGLTGIECAAHVQNCYTLNNHFDV